MDKIEIIIVINNLWFLRFVIGSMNFFLLINLGVNVKSSEYIVSCVFDKVFNL